MNKDEKHNFATPLGILLRALGDLLVLNLLWFVTSIPIVTLGASSSAVYAVLLRRDRKGEQPLFRTYFKSFGTGFLQSTLLWLISVALGFIAWIDIRFALTFEGAIRYVYLFAGSLIALGALIIACIGIPQQAYFSNTLKNYMKNAFSLAFIAPGRFLLIALISAAPIALILLTSWETLSKIGVIFFLWGFSAPAYLISHILNGVFDKVEGTKNENDSISNA